MYFVRASHASLSSPHNVCCALWQKRFTEARIWWADLVHLKGLTFKVRCQLAAVIPVRVLERFAIGQLVVERPNVPRLPLRNSRFALVP